MNHGIVWVWDGMGPMPKWKFYFGILWTQSRPVSSSWAMNSRETRGWWFSFNIRYIRYDISFMIFFAWYSGERERERSPRYSKMIKTHQTSRPHFQWAPWPQNAWKCHEATVSGGCSITFGWSKFQTQSANWLVMASLQLSRIVLPKGWPTF